MRFGIKPKILLMFVAILALTATLHVALAAYFTDRQNQRLAFDSLRRNLVEWRNDLEESTVRLRGAAVAFAGDAVTLNQLEDQVDLEARLRRAVASSREQQEIARNLAYRKSTTLNRLQLMLRAAGFSSVAVYVSGRLSHYVSGAEAGMTIPRPDGRSDAWITTTQTDSVGNVPLERWVASPEGSTPSRIPLQTPMVKGPQVSVDFRSPSQATLQIAVPVSGAGPGSLAVIVFRRDLGRDFLQSVANETGKWPVMASPDGAHRLQVNEFDPHVGDLLQQMPAASVSGAMPRIVERTVSVGRESFNEELTQWSFENEPRLVLGLASSRATTLQNIRQTTLALVSATALILLVSLGVGILWVGRFINPIVALTDAVKEIGRKSTLAAEANPTSRAAIEELRPISTRAPDEVGDLAAAFNTMITELRRALERQALEAARDAALAEAMRIAQLRSEFLAQMSHELRTPLNAILGYAQILQFDKNLTERQVNGLTIIQESGHHLLTLINDILDLARLEAAKLELFPREVDLGAFLQVVADIIRVKAQEKNLEFVYEAADDLPAAVRVDDKRLRQVLLNLLGNAVKFTDRGQITLRVRTVASAGLAATSSRLRFEVQDTGIGMTEAQLARIFHSFEQVSEAARREGGTGLGLAISRQLVRLMGGDIQVQSRPGEGSVFGFELEVPRAEVRATSFDPYRSVAGYQGPPRRILVVDDVAENRAMLIDALTVLGFEVSSANNGKEGLERAQAATPDLILMDVMMPVMDGLEAMHRMRLTPRLARVPVIAISASTTADDQGRSLAAGANAFIPKPIEHNLLLRTIGELLSLKWIYAPAREPEAGSGLAAARMHVPPAEEMEVLYGLALAGNMRDIRDRARYLNSLDSRYAPFADRLASLAQRYQSQAIVAMIESYRTALQSQAADGPSEPSATSRLGA